MPLTPMLRDFALCYLFSVAAAAGLVIGIAAIGGPQTGSGIAVAPWLAALWFAGYRQGMRAGDVPAGHDAWRVAGALLALLLGLNVLIAAGMIALDPATAAATLAPLDQAADPSLIAVLAILVASCLGLLLLVHRYVIPLAARAGTPPREI